MKVLQATALLALIASPALALAQNTTTPSNNGPSARKIPVPEISGQPGGKNGPAANAQGQVANSDQTSSTTRLQDTSKIPGKAGSKSGPAVMPPTSRSAQKP